MWVSALVLPAVAAAAFVCQKGTTSRKRMSLQQQSMMMSTSDFCRSRAVVFAPALSTTGGSRGQQQQWP